MSTAESAIKAQILRALRSGDLDEVYMWPAAIDDCDALELWDDVSSSELADWAHEALGEFRNAGESYTGPDFQETDPDGCRYYQSECVAKKLDDSRWVGWIYWYGGGKHSDPESIDWVDCAVFLDCVEEQKLVTVRTWSLKP